MMILYYLLITTMACRLYRNTSHEYSCMRQIYWGIDLYLHMRQILVSSQRCLFPLSYTHSSPSLTSFLPSLLHTPPSRISSSPSIPTYPHFQTSLLPTLTPSLSPSLPTLPPSRLMSFYKIQAGNNTLT